MHTQNNMSVDVVDNRNVVIGQMPRDQVLVRRANFRTVHIVLKAYGNIVILQKLRTDHSRSPGRLGSSVAGYLRSGESYPIAAKRKMQEELRTVSGISFLGRITMQDENSRKFVGVFSGALSTLPDFDRDQIAGLVYMDETELAAQLVSNPEQFTETFRNVYAAYGPAFK